MGEILKHGSLSVGFIGLAETLVALTGKHNGESEESQQLGIEIISHMRKLCDQRSEIEQLNYTLIGTPAEGLSGRFVKIDREKYGNMTNITSHEFTNAGHITYVELDGDTTKNLSAFEDIILYMKEAGIGYGSINHPLDRDPLCGYTGVINDTCPGCGRKEIEGQPFERIRRITGYLVGDLNRFNNAKRAEVSERVKHG